MIQSQLAMLTCSLDYVVWYLSTTYAFTPNVEGGYIDPSPAAFSTTANTSDERQVDYTQRAAQA